VYTALQMGIIAQITPPISWALFRYLRLRWYSLLQRNPLLNGQRGGGLRDHLRVAKGILEAARHPPQLVRADDCGQRLWHTCMGDFWAPPGADLEYVSRIAAEINADVYSYKGGDGSVVFDCGANIGFFTRQALSRGASLVVAFEPSPATASCFRLNFDEEIRQGRVVLIDKGVWNVADRLFLLQHAANPASDSISIGSPSVDQPGVYIDVTTVDKTFRELRLSRLDFLKMDVEGAELEALDGALDVIQRFHPAIGIGTEHGADMLQNNIEVIRKIQEAHSTSARMRTQ
jgi:FkbM family methyltransferase